MNLKLADGKLINQLTMSLHPMRNEFYFTSFFVILVHTIQTYAMRQRNDAIKFVSTFNLAL